MSSNRFCFWSFGLACLLSAFVLTFAFLKSVLSATSGIFIVQFPAFAPTFFWLLLVVFSVFFRRSIIRFFTATPASFFHRCGVPPLLVNWLFYSCVVVAFGSTLFGFLKGNLLAIQSVFAVPHDARTAQNYFAVVRYVVWSVTIAACLFGYTYSLLSPLWSEHVRAVDFSLWAWVVNGACYPMFSVFVAAFLPPLQNHGHGPLLGSFSVYVLALELFVNVLYAATILNLGRNFGLMSDKGKVVSTGFYSVVRHPSYTLEICMLLLMLVNGFVTPSNWLAGFALVVVPYVLRALREDVFMTESNPEFISYKQKVPYKFFPGVV